MSPLDLDPLTRTIKIPMMNAEPKDETANNGPSSPEPPRESPRSKLRDLPPEKDPMGAGRDRGPKRDLPR